MANGENITIASKEWANRPDDERYLNLDDLENAVQSRFERSKVIDSETGRIQVVASSDENMYIKTEAGEVAPTHWSFGQLAIAAEAPAGYLRRLPAPIAAINVQWGLEHSKREACKLLLDNGTSLRAMTSETYGRIWDIDVVKSVKKINESGIWKVPAASYATKNPKRATTLYASSHDVFIFLVDPEHAIEVDGEVMFRGFITSNSETGAGTFYLSTFLYRYVCDNRIIWGAKTLGEVKIKHSLYAPDRFVREGARALEQYAGADTTEVSKRIHTAKLLEVAKNDSSAIDWLQDRGFTKNEAKQGVAYAVREEGRAGTAWELINGITAYAREKPHTDDRVAMEVRAGKLFERVTATA